MARKLAGVVALVIEVLCGCATLVGFVAMIVFGCIITVGLPSLILYDYWPDELVVTNCVTVGVAYLLSELLSVFGALCVHTDRMAHKGWGRWASASPPVASEGEAPPAHQAHDHQWCGAGGYDGARGCSFVRTVRICTGRFSSSPWLQLWAVLPVRSVRTAQGCRSYGSVSGRSN